jgi:hypothetical protein
MGIHSVIRNTTATARIDNMMAMSAVKVVFLVTYFLLHKDYTFAVESLGTRLLERKISEYDELDAGFF